MSEITKVSSSMLAKEIKESLSNGQNPSYATGEYEGKSYGVWKINNKRLKTQLTKEEVLKEYSTLEVVNFANTTTGDSWYSIVRSSEKEETFGDHFKS